MRLMIVLALVGLAKVATGAGLGDAARVHYERGLAKYNLADFAAAVDEFKQSYELTKAPRLLFNIAQAYRLAKDWEHALYFYNTYLRNDPHAPNRADVEARIDEMKQKLDEQAHAPPPVTPPPLAPGSVAAPNVAPPPLMAPGPPPSSGPSPRTLKIAGAATLGAGLLIAAAGAGLLGLANSDANTVRNVVNGGGVWSADLQRTYDEGMRSQTAAIALLAVGGAAIASGVIVTAIGFGARKKQLALDVGPARIGLHGRF